jgi:hypothetical protein
VIAPGSLRQESQAGEPGKADRKRPNQQPLRGDRGGPQQLRLGQVAKTAGLRIEVAVRIGDILSGIEECFFLFADL